jgi:hypothetical protein
MNRTLSSALMLGLLFFPAIGLVGCGEESKSVKTETITTPGGKTTTSTETTVKSTGDKPPPNSAGQTGKSER